MLVLGRKEGESLRINDDIRITVLRVKGGKMRLAIEAPREVSVLREEVWERYQNENRDNSAA